MIQTVFLLLMIFTLTNPTIAQPTIKVSGKVVDEATKESINFASVSVRGKPMGTVTNSEGEFDFYVPADYSNDTLIVSHVGYKSYRQKIADLTNTDKLILLTPAPFLLDEVVIIEKNLTGKEIVEKAIRQLKSNYPTHPFCLQGFFREIEEENGKYVLLTEAAVDLYDKKFDGKRKKGIQESVDIKEMRRSIHYSGRGNRDNIGYALADLIENNDVRYNRGMLDTQRNEFSIDTITSYNDRPVYGISMANKTDRGMMYIDMETFGFLKISMERQSHNPHTKYYHGNMVSDSLKIGRVWFRFSVEFEVYMDKLYPRRMHESELNEIYYTKTGKIKIVAIETLEFIVNNVIPQKESKEARQLKYGLILNGGEYHKDFWNNYNSLKLTPLNEKLIRDLEKEISLPEQFERQK